MQVSRNNKQRNLYKNVICLTSEACVLELQHNSTEHVDKLPYFIKKNYFSPGVVQTNKYYNNICKEGYTKIVNVMIPWIEVVIDNAVKMPYYFKNILEFGAQIKQTKQCT